MNGLLFSLPGTPVIYYGDEIGMGDNIFLGDRNGVRTPMQWTAGPQRRLSQGNAQSSICRYHRSGISLQAVNVEAQQNNPHSLLWWMKRWPVPRSAASSTTATNVDCCAAPRR